MYVVGVAHDALAIVFLGDFGVFTILFLDFHRFFSLQCCSCGVFPVVSRAQNGPKYP